MPLPGAGSKDGAYAKSACKGGPGGAPALCLLQGRPFACKLLQLGRHAHVVGNDGFEPFGVSRLSGQTAHVIQLRAIGKGVAVAHRRRADAKQRADVGDESVAFGPVVTDGGLGVGPRSVEERQNAVVEDVEETDQGRIVGIAQAIPGVLGQVNRQRTVGAEGAQEVDADAGRKTFLTGLGVGQRGRRKGQRCLLAETNRLIARSRRLSQAHAIRKRALDGSQQREEIVLVRRLLDGTEELVESLLVRGPNGLLVYSAGRRPSLAGHRTTSLR